MELHSNEELCIVHYKDNTRIAVTLFNGKEERFSLENPMNRKETQDFYETQVMKV